MNVVYFLLALGVIVGLSFFILRLQKLSYQNPVLYDYASGPMNLEQLRRYGASLSSDEPHRRYVALRSHAVQKGWDYSGEIYGFEEPPLEGHLAAIEGGLQTLRANPSEGYVTFLVDRDRFIQESFFNLNCFYPWDEPPDAVIDILCNIVQLPSPDVVDWKPQHFVMIEFQEEVELSALAQWIDLYFLVLLKSGANYPLKVTYGEA